MNSATRNILINCLSARSGGAVSYVKNAISRILKLPLPDNVRLTALCNQSQADLIQAPEGRLLRVDTDGIPGWKRNLWEKQNLPGIVRDQGIETVFVPYQNLAASLHVRTVLMLRNMEPFFYHRYRYSLSTRIRNRILRSSTIRSIRSASHVIAVSDFAGDFMERHFDVPRQRITRIYHGRDPWFSERDDSAATNELLAGLKVTRPFLLTCGSILPYRRTEDVILAFRKFSTTASPAPSLVVAGSGNDPVYRKKLENLAACPGVGANIRFTGHVPAAEMRALYQAAELVILATEIEACPNIAIEAMSAGCAILASDCHPLPEIIGRENARFFRPRNHDDLSRAIGELTSSPVQREQFRQRARERALSFSWDDCAAATLQLLLQA